MGELISRCISSRLNQTTSFPAFFASSGVAVKPSPQIPDEDPWPGPPGQSRFAVVYHFYSMAHKHRLRLVIPVEEAVTSEPETGN